MKKKYLNNKLFYKEANEFKANDKTTGAEGWKIMIAIDPEHPEKFETLCYTSSKENINDNITSFVESCGGGVSNNAITSFDYSVDIEAYLARGRISEKLVQAKFDKTVRENVPIRLFDSLSNRVTQFQGVISISGIDRMPNDLTKITGSISVAQGEIIETEIMDITTLATGSCRLITAEDTSITIKYSYDANDEDIADFKISVLDNEDLTEKLSVETGLREGDDITLKLGTITTPLSPSTIYQINLMQDTRTISSTLMATKKAGSVRKNKQTKLTGGNNNANNTENK